MIREKVEEWKNSPSHVQYWCCGSPHKAPQSPSTSVGTTGKRHYYYHSNRLCYSNGELRQHISARDRTGTRTGTQYITFSLRAIYHSKTVAPIAALLLSPKSQMSKFAKSRSLPIALTPESLQVGGTLRPLPHHLTTTSPTTMT